MGHKLHSGVNMGKLETHHEEAQAIIELFQQKNFVKATDEATKLVAKYPNSALARNLLGTAFLQNKQFDEAKNNFEAAINLDGKSAQAYVNLGNYFNLQEDFNRALDSYQMAYKCKPDLLAAYTNSANIYLKLNRFHDASIMYEKGLLVAPERLDLKMALANVYFRTENYLNAQKYFAQINQVQENNWEAQYKHAVRNYSLGINDTAVAELKLLLEKQSDYLQAYVMLGKIFMEVGEYVDAEHFFKEAIKIDQKHKDCWDGLGRVYFSKRQFFESLQAFERALEIDSDDLILKCNYANALPVVKKPEKVLEYIETFLSVPNAPADAFFIKANILSELNDYRQAIENYEISLKLRPNNEECFANLCYLLERTNKLEKLRQTLDKARYQFNILPDRIKYFEALTFYRSESFDECLEIISSIDDTKVLGDAKLSFLQLKAKVLEKLGRFNSAFDNFKFMNETVLKSEEYLSIDRDLYFNTLSEMVTQIELSNKASKPTKRVFSPKRKHVFLVGFPRSGTTLLDTMLRSHPDISVIEEKPLVEVAQNHLDPNLRYNILGLENCSKEDIEQVRKEYFYNVGTAFSEDSTKKITTIIDKFPLNITRVPFISQIVPEAQYIFAVRHPIDCVLSCWMQKFKLNDAMVNMFDLKRTFQFYCKSMELFFGALERYELEVHTVKYEDMIADYQKEISQILNFLGHEWNNNIQNYQKTALTREAIRTPSYSQVVEPIYQSAVFRWQNYQSFLEQYSEEVQPWIKRLGYTT